MVIIVLFAIVKPASSGAPFFAQRQARNASDKRVSGDDAQGTLKTETSGYEAENQTKNRCTGSKFCQ